MAILFLCYGNHRLRSRSSTFSECMLSTGTRCESIWIDGSRNTIPSHTLGRNGFGEYRSMLTIASNRFQKDDAHACCSVSLVGRIRTNINPSFRSGCLYPTNIRLPRARCFASLWSTVWKGILRMIIVCTAIYSSSFILLQRHRRRERVFWVWSLI